MMSDWLQGPYVYALYESYGFTQGDNAILFVFGFGSAAAFGTFIGGMADQMGRRKFALIYCAVYFLSCASKHFNDFRVLIVGRLLGGVATSLLFSVFESWMVASHFKQGFNGDQLGDTFTKAYFGNSIV